MKHTLIALTLCLAFGSLLPGCSKSRNATPTANSAGSAGSQPGSDSASSAGGAGANGPVDLKLKWEDGKTYSMEMDLSQNSEIDMPNRPQPMKQAMKLSEALHFAPDKDLDDGGHQVALEFDGSSLNFSQNGRSLVSFDSTQNTPAAANNPAGSVGAVMRAMLGVPLEYIFGADGKLVKIDGTDALQGRIAAAVPNAQQRAQMQQMYSEDTLKQYGAFGESLPGHPINIGDTWSESRDVMTAGGMITVNTTFTFKEWQQLNGHNCVHLVATGDVPAKNASLSMGGAMVDVQGGTISSDVWFDPALGMMVAFNSDQDLKMKITVRTRTMMDHTSENIRMTLVDLTP